MEFELILNNGLTELVKEWEESSELGVKAQEQEWVTSACEMVRKADFLGVRCCGRQPLRCPQWFFILVFMPLCTVLPCGWPGLSDSLLRDSMQQKWWHAISKTKLQRGFDLCAAHTVAPSLSLTCDELPCRAAHGARNCCDISSTAGEDLRCCSRHVVNELAVNPSWVKSGDDYSPGRHLEIVKELMLVFQVAKFGGSLLHSRS